MSFYTYILFSEKLNGYYIGYTGDSLKSRLHKHLHSAKGHTSKANDWKIVYSQTFDTKQAAMKREIEIKAWKSKIKIEKLILSSTE